MGGGPEGAGDKGQTAGGSGPTGKDRVQGPPALEAVTDTEPGAQGAAPVHRWAQAWVKGIGGIAAGVAVAVLSALAIGAVHHATARPSPPIPLTATVQLGVGGCPSWWIIRPPSRAGALMPEPGEEPRGAVLVSRGWIGLTLQGIPGRTAVVQSMRAEVIARRLPVAGVQIPAVTCQGSTKPSYFAFDLRQSRSFARPIAGFNGHRIRPDYFPFVVREDVPEQFYVRVSTANNAVLWRIVLHWSSDGRQGNLIVDNNGRPLEVSSGSQAPRLCEDISTNRWLPQKSDKCTTVR